MLSFKALSERKTKVKINPKQAEITEKECECGEEEKKEKKKCPKCKGKGCKHCGGSGYHDEDGEGADMSEAKKDSTYLEPDMKKRQKNNEKARKEMDKVPSQKNPHFESTGDQAYGSQEEVSEESTEEVAETETKLLTFGQFDELYKGKHGQSEKEYQDGRSQGGKMVSGDSKGSGAKYSHGRRVDDGGAGPQPAGGSKKPKAQGKMDRGGRAELQMRKANLKAKNEEVVNEEGADSLKDRRMERGGVGGNQRYNKPVSNTPNTFGKKKPKYDGMSAVAKVKASIEKQYGKGAIMDTKKKK
ncbi:hypothetical protein AAJ62_gp168 [Synechococcus phage ACG-2014g]|uniref:Gp186 n=1 Tax=Synechococcus phage ACG-2014g TaxID=1493512 RepID=A0A0E3FBA1_9CAUD|nr:hypothetical protein AAJ62_gp168 [Synechococcus phage ACG-2014g]AIX24512.1 hypothetical protein Syn7803US105_168 [Synechococcus phage ACG-2014g]